MNHRVTPVLLLCAVTLAACGGTATTVPPSATASPSPTATPTPTPTPVATAQPTPTPPPPPAAVVLKMIRVGSGFAFSPTTLTIRHGVQLPVTNTTFAPHTVTADGGAFDSGTVSPNMTITMTFSMPGRYPFHCQIHPYMTGTITVR